MELENLKVVCECDQMRTLLSTMYLFLIIMVKCSRPRMFGQTSLGILGGERAKWGSPVAMAYALKHQGCSHLSLSGKENPLKSPYAFMMCLAHISFNIILLL